MVEYLLPKQKVAGSNPVSRSIQSLRTSILSVLHRAIESNRGIQDFRIFADVRQGLLVYLNT